MPSPTSVNRRTLLTLLGGSIAAPFVAPHMALAQEAWPTRPVRYVNGFPAGGATDSLSRILCQKMSELSGQSFVVENRAGAGGVLGADAVAKAQPDGYTVGLGGIASNACWRSEAMPSCLTTRCAISPSFPGCGSCQTSWARQKRSCFPRI